MIVRILSEGQYDLGGSALAELKRIDEDLFSSIATGDADGYRRHFDAALSVVRGQGDALPHDKLVESDLVLPAPDTTLDEARKLFTDHVPEPQ